MYHSSPSGRQAGRHRADRQAGRHVDGQAGRQDVPHGESSVPQRTTKAKKQKTASESCQKPHFSSATRPRPRICPAALATRPRICPAALATRPRICPAALATRPRICPAALATRPHLSPDEDGRQANVDLPAKPQREDRHVSDLLTSYGDDVESIMTCSGGGVTRQPCRVLMCLLGVLFVIVTFTSSLGTIAPRPMTSIGVCQTDRRKQG